MFCGECGSAVGARAPRQAGNVSDTDDRPHPSTGPDDSGTPPHGDPLTDAPAADAADEAGVAGEHVPDAAGEDVPDVAGEDEVGMAGEEGPDENGPDEAGEDEADDGAPDSAPTDIQPVLDDAAAEPPHGDPVATGAGAPARLPGSPASEDESERDATRGDADPDGPDPMAPLTPEERFAAERLLDPDSPADKFVLQFSTGESATVYGSGLVGRNPAAEPGEYVDHFVVIRDPGRSVSKTHLEFGQDSGGFWVLDRFSGNGSVLREPESAPKRCEPGRRYFVARGTRVEIGDQFFVVS